jgi:hypothetical protein
MKEWCEDSRGHRFLNLSALVFIPAVIPESLPRADQEIPYLLLQQEQQQIQFPMEQSPPELYEQPLPQEHKPISPQTHDRRVLELQQHLQHQQASHEQIPLLKEKLHETEMSQLKLKLEELQVQLEHHPVQQHHPRYQLYQWPINLQPMTKKQRCNAQILILKYHD